MRNRVLVLLDGTRVANSVVPAAVMGHEFIIPLLRAVAATPRSSDEGYLQQQLTRNVS